ncbi:hypothetical protein JAAARDRAFT_31507 [Jaapia argillacea MUCL 33604]|uniref:Protein PBN1 n=1 Tax=Jaapia argillacea MUCL 33604 TaxID=933084 RepID=A0A067QD72_9AGAM|nr:hypothetical protein JAAARDRAFT_31507 [Jaapia argillacea MUCL 33604]
MTDSEYCFSSSLHPGRSFHSTSSTKIVSSSSPLHRNCTLHLILTLPSDVFVDPYELALHRQYYGFKLNGRVELELPVVALDSDASTLLLNISLDDAPHSEWINVTVNVPLHARYPDVWARDKLEHHVVSLPWPTVFWACDTFSHEDTVSLLEASTFKSWASSRSERLGLMQVPPCAHSKSRMETLSVPHGNAGDVDLVETVTTVVVSLAFVALMYSMLKTASRLASLGGSGKLERHRN